MEIKITLTEAEAKAMSFIATSPQDWAENAVKERARIAMKQIFDSEIKRMSEDPSIESIPADIEQVVLDADIVLAADREVLDGINPQI
jgi:hypothetical protein